jgi:decaprenylphospho-beta-D-ribofuranose 2-oxidase
MPRWADKELQGWGRMSSSRGPVARPERVTELAAVVADASAESLLPRGAGRSYGDAALNSAGRTVSMERLDRLLSLDGERGEVVAESGVTFRDLMTACLPLGFMPPVTPGTGFATLGGGIANDVHGKNHHRDGSLGQHLAWFDLRLPSGEVRRVDLARDEALFRATVGGLGLTGIVERLCLRLKRVPSNAVDVRKRRIRDLDHFLEAFAEEQERADYVVGWIDALASGTGLGRGILEAATPSKTSVELPPARPRRVPIALPALALNPLSVRVFNALYRGRVPAGGVETSLPYGRFLFPLDALLDWNRIYGRRGFFQFQCVLPFESGREALKLLLERIARSGQGSFLAVLKAMGPAGLGFLSFPRPGYTLALDFPNAPGVRALIAELECITADHSGRVYFAKDATLSPELVPRMYPELARWRAVLADIDPAGRMHSDLARRLQLREEQA